MKIKESDLTPWFPAGVKPAYVGEYSVKDPHGAICLGWWSGKWWSWGYFEDTDITFKSLFLGSASNKQNKFQFRGLKVKPKGFKP